MIKKLIQHKDKLYLLQLASLQILINFVTNFLIVKKIGFGAELDVFYIAMAVFAFLLTSVGWSISSVLTPILIENREKHIEGQMFINLVLIVFPIFTIAMISMFFWSKLIFTNYLDTVEYTKILMIQGMYIVTFLFSALNIMFFAILQERNEYVKINFLNMISAIVGLAFVYFTIDTYGIYAASMSQIVMQLFLFITMGFLTFSTIKRNFSFDRESLSLLWHRMKYIFIGSFYYRTDGLIQSYIVSYLTPGFLSLMGYVEKVYGAIITVLNTSIAGPTITKFSNLIKVGNYAQVKKTLYSYLILLFIIDLSIFIVGILFGEDLFLYFFSEQIEENLLPLLFSTMMFLFAIVFGKTLGQILHNLLLSLKMEKIITIVGILNFTISVITKIFGVYFYGVNGLLGAILFSQLENIIVNAWIVNRELKNKIRKRV